MLAENINAVIGVDTHTDTHSASLVSPLGAELAHITVPATGAGYLQLLEWATEHAPGPRLAWAVEGTRSHGAGLTRLLTSSGQTVIEAARPPRRNARPGGKSDPRDALLAARQALSAAHHAQPRGDGPREALRLLLVVRNTSALARTAAINTLKALILTAQTTSANNCVVAPSSTSLPASADCASKAATPSNGRTLMAALRGLASRIRVLDQDMRANERALTDIVRSVLPELLDQPGLGPFSAAQLLVAFSHPNRCRNEAEFAALGGVAPLEASSGRVVRHRLNRHGDRQLNRALHTIATSRMRYHDETKTYRDRRIAEGKSDYEIRRCLKRSISRALYRLMQRTLASEVPPAELLLSPRT